MGLSDCRVEALLAVSDLERAQRFYEQQLGLVPGEEEKQDVRYPCPGENADLRLSVAGKRRSVAGHGWFGIKTDERGVFDAGRFRAAWIKDPDGNTTAITEAPG